jgi:hypothetical protein
MQNIKTTINGNKLIIEIDTTVDLGPSKSGKTRLVGTSSGNQAIKGSAGGDVVIGVNVYRKG